MIAMILQIEKKRLAPILAFFLTGLASTDSWETSTVNRIWSGPNTRIGIGIADASTQLPLLSDQLSSLGSILATDGVGFLRLRGETQ